MANLLYHPLPLSSFSSSSLHTRTQFNLVCKSGALQGIRPWGVLSSKYSSETSVSSQRISRGVSGSLKVRARGDESVCRGQHGEDLGGVTKIELGRRHGVACATSIGLLLLSSNSKAAEAGGFLDKYLKRWAIASAAGFAEYHTYLGNSSTVAVQRVQKLPANNTNKVTYACDRHTSNHVVEGGFKCNSRTDSMSRTFTGRRATMLALLCAPSLLSVPFSQAFEFPKFMEDEFDQEEDALVELFAEVALPLRQLRKSMAAIQYIDATKSVVSVQNVESLGTKVVGQPVMAEEAVKVEGIGSGFIWDKFGHIVTNYHVIAKLATDSSGRQKAQVSVLGGGGKVSLYDATLVGLDATRDLAVLKIDAPEDMLAPIPVGTSEDLRVGQSCFAIGNPYGYEHTLTTGVVSGLGREIPSPAGVPIPGAIQTDAAINAGNSGGPLLDSFGRIIGVNTATFTRTGTGMSSGVNFAIPIDTVRMLIPGLIVNGTISAPRPATPVMPSTRESFAKRRFNT